MKKVHLLYILPVLVLALSINSCGKKSPDPTPVTENNNNNNNNPADTMAEYQDFCEGSLDSICEFPYYIMPIFLPDGYYDTGENTTVFTIDAAETAEYENQNIRIEYTWNGGYWGAHFLNNGAWGASFKIKPGATKLKFSVRMNYSATVTFNAFGDGAVHGKLVKTKLSSPVATPVWEDVEITLTNVPTTGFNAPLGMTIADYVGTNGDKITVDLKNIRIE